MVYFGSFIVVFVVLVLGRICDSAPVSKPELSLDRTMTANIPPTLKVSSLKQTTRVFSNGATLRIKKERMEVVNTGFTKGDYIPPSSSLKMTHPHSDMEEPCWSITPFPDDPEMSKPCNTPVEHLQSQSQLVGDALGTFTVRAVQSMVFMAGVFFVVVGLIRLKRWACARMSGESRPDLIEKGEARGTWVGLPDFGSLFDYDHSGDFFSLDGDDDDYSLTP